MVILVKEYEFSETESHATYVIQSQGISPTSCDIYSAPLLLKINYAGKLCIIDFPQEIKPLDSVATIGNNQIKIEVLKESPGLWHTASLVLGKDEAVSRRSGTISVMEGILRAVDEQKKAAKIEQEKFSREALWDIDRRDKERIAAKKAEEKEKAEEELNRWAAQPLVRQWDDVDGDDSDNEEDDNKGSNSSRSNSKAKTAKKNNNKEETPQDPVASMLGLTPAEAAADASQAPAPAPQDEKDVPIYARGRPDVDDEDSDDERKEQEARAKERRQLELERAKNSVKLPEPRALPAPRRHAEPVTLTFTPAPSNLPMRDGKASTDPMDAKAISVPAPPSSAAEGQNETNPAWLKDRGDDFFKKGDFLSALNAYSEAVARQPTNAVLYANRAAAYLRVEKFGDALNDCNIGLAIIPKNETGSGRMPVAEMSKLYVKMLLRRGAAQAGLGALPNAVEDYEEALRIEPGNQSVRDDLDRMLQTLKAKKP